MGMFDKDKLYGGKRLDEEFNVGQTFILWDVTVLPDKVPTSVGDADKTLLKVSYTDKPKEVFIVGTLASAIADKAKDAEPDKDFPAVVALDKVPGNFGKEALVIQFHSPWTGDKPKAADMPSWEFYMEQDDSNTPSDHPLDD